MIARFSMLADLLVCIILTFATNLNHVLNRRDNDARISSQLNIFCTADNQPYSEHRKAARAFTQQGLIGFRDAGNRHAHPGIVKQRGFSDGEASDFWRHHHFSNNHIIAVI